VSASLGSLTFDALDPEGLARFWAGVLGRDVRTGADGAYDVRSDEPGQVALRFVRTVEPKTGPNRTHLHVTSTDEEDFRAVVERVLTLGGAHLDVGQLPDEPHVVLADPEGNELCVIPPDNDFLRGTGRLGELAGDGSRAVGVFWSEALGWPLVWDQDEETAVQSPEGGTKVAWGGPPREALHGSRDRLRLEVVTDDVDGLLSLGATRVAEGWLRDPDGNDVDVRPAAAVPRP
jgi:hypothetical protein